MVLENVREMSTEVKGLRNATADQETTTMLNREEWNEIQEVRQRTPFESKLARRKASLRTNEACRHGSDAATASSGCLDLTVPKARKSV
ncbi:hypothetical protein FRX31_004816 [Thalictrum thalictroides]|uniref:Uncharacterized protein n=1 Tax=Thalictrum thalictroides TaxID=46969 RepID=A0A7J6X9K3_THATH|nr:hypothetical protein FRX31_004816 [Thalictrum thalictroides]